MSYEDTTSIFKRKRLIQRGANTNIRTLLRLAEPDFFRDNGNFLFMYLSRTTSGRSLNNRLE